MKHAVAAVILLIAIAPAVCGSVPSPADYDVYRGVVSFKNFGDHVIGVLVIDDRARAGGYVHLFRLWTEAVVKPISVNAASASVEFRGRELVLLIPEKQLFYVFVVSDAQFSAPTAPAGFTSVRYVGYGLNHEIHPVSSTKGTSSSGRNVAANDICNMDTVDCYLENPDPNGGSGSGGASCDDGGPGANACSVNSNSFGGCSVGCSAGYYACCNGGGFASTPHCYCVHN
jgi:hypothetical protein